MKLNMKNKIIIALSLIVNASCFAQANVYLSFHMGLGANGHYEIGGTMENKSLEALPHSALTYITIDKNCKPSAAKVANLGPIKANDTLDFRIPVEGVLSSYRILSITAWNSLGVPVGTEDKTIEVIKKRDKNYIKSCKSNSSN